MADRPLQHLLRHLRRVAAPAVGSVADMELLGRFADRRDEAAFEALVWRHGPLIYGVCRRVLGHTQDAEDAFQAAFLILARKASNVRRRAAVGPWLYRVAQRVALRARVRMKSAGPLPDDLSAVPIPDAAENSDLRRVLNEEIDRLPKRYRTAVVLRYLEGRSTNEAADALGCPPGTVLSRLAWARKRLRTRLTARGAALPAGLAAIGVQEAAGAVPARWVTAAVVAAGEFAAGGRTGRPALLAAEVLRAMLMSKLRVGAAVVFGALAAGTGLLLPGTTPGRVDHPDKVDHPTVEVTVVRPTRQTTGDSLDFGGNAVPSATVEIRSRITSQIEKVAFQPGARVKRGDLLFELDSRTGRADCLKAEAELQRAEGRLRHAEADLALVKATFAQNAASQGELSQRQGVADEARGDLMVAKAGLERARLDLDATRITSPIDGQTGGTVLSAGNLATPTTKLVTVVSVDPVYVEFSVDEQNLLLLRKSMQQGEVTAHIGLAGHGDLRLRGKIVFVDNLVNNRSVGVRAVLPNPKGDILPGMQASIRLMIGEPREELILPRQGVRFTRENHPFALVAGSNDAVEWRGLKLSSLRPSGGYVVTSGIGPNDRVVVDDLPGPGASIRFRDAEPHQ